MDSFSDVMLSVILTRDDMEELDEVDNAEGTLSPFSSEGPLSSGLLSKKVRTQKNDISISFKTSSQVKATSENYFFQHKTKFVSDRECLEHFSSVSSFTYLKMRPSL